MQLSFCVSSSVNQSYNFVSFSLPQLSSENMSSMIRTILSWCQSRDVRSLHSVPNGLVAERSDAVRRAIGLGAVSMDDLWEHRLMVTESQCMSGWGSLLIEVEQLVRRSEVNADFEDFDLFYMRLCS